MSKPIKGRNGETRGYRTESGNRVNVSDEQGRMVGWYDKAQDKTFDRSGAYVGTTDQTRDLLEDRK